MKPNEVTIRRIVVLWLVCERGTMGLFLTHHRCSSNCHRSSNKATDPISIALSSSQYAKDYLYSHSKLFCLNIKTYSPPQKIWLWTVQSIIAYCCGRFTYARASGTFQHSTVISRWASTSVVMFSKTQHTLPSAVNKHVQPLVDKHVIGCIYLHCCLPVLGQCQVQGGEKTIMHCLSPTFSSLSCSDTEEVCLAAPETVLSSNHQATTMAAIISLSMIFLFLHFLICHPGPFFFLFYPNGPRYTHTVCFRGWNQGIIFGPRSNPRKDVQKNLKWQIDGHLWAYCIYLFLQWPRSTSWGW